MAWETEIADVAGGETIESSWGNAVRDRTVHGPTNFASLPADADTAALAFTTDLGWCFKTAGGWRVLQFGELVLSGLEVVGAVDTTPGAGSPPITGAVQHATRWTVPDYLDGAEALLTVRGQATEDGSQSGTTALSYGWYRSGASNVAVVTQLDVQSPATVTATGAHPASLVAGHEYGVWAAHHAVAQTRGKVTAMSLYVDLTRPGLA